MAKTARYTLCHQLKIDFKKQKIDFKKFKPWTLDLVGWGGKQRKTKGNFVSGHKRKLSVAEVMIRKI